MYKVRRKQENPKYLEACLYQRRHFSSFAVSSSSSSFGPAAKTSKRVHYWVVVVQSQNSG